MLLNSQQHYSFDWRQYRPGEGNGLLFYAIRQQILELSLSRLVRVSAVSFAGVASKNTKRVAPASVISQPICACGRNGRLLLGQHDI